MSNHIAICSCPAGYTGDAFRICSPTPKQRKYYSNLPTSITLVFTEEPTDPCNPSPCGPNTQCRTVSGAAICECLPGYHGNPTSSGCRPECVISADCPRDRACVRSKCIDPCPGVCGFNAQCNVINHSPVCSCPQPLTGDPFLECRQAPGKFFRQTPFENLENYSDCSFTSGSLQSVTVQL